MQCLLVKMAKSEWIEIITEVEEAQGKAYVRTPGCLLINLFSWHFSQGCQKLASIEKNKNAYLKIKIYSFERKT